MVSELMQRQIEEWANGFDIPSREKGAIIRELFERVKKLEGGYNGTRKKIISDKMPK